MQINDEIKYAWCIVHLWKRCVNTCNIFSCEITMFSFANINPLHPIAIDSIIGLTGLNFKELNQYLCTSQRVWIICIPSDMSIETSLPEMFCWTEPDWSRSEILASQNPSLKERHITMSVRMGAVQCIGVSLFIQCRTVVWWFLMWLWALNCIFALHRFAVECLKDNKFSFASDVWAFGVTLYEIFTHGHSNQSPPKVPI